MAESTPSSPPAGGPAHGKNDAVAPPAAPAPGAAPLRDFAEIAIERGYCTAQQIAQALVGRPPGVELRTLLVQKGVINEDQARACERGTRGTTLIAGFEILEKVGQGGMGAVFRARQVSMDRIVALKILPPKLAQDPAFKQRFLQEAKLSAKLSHLNIISGIDCGEAGGFTYFAMEFVDGRTVKQILKEKGKLPHAEAFSIVRQVAEALVYAESKSMVHRDIKPDNIMLTAEGRAKLCDLGLAKQQQQDADLTQAGRNEPASLAVGTPNYISPEQARGERNVDTRADIYSLGATFYHLLAGGPPFAAPSNAALMALQISGEAQNPCDFDPLLPTSYGQIISKMMAKFPEDRYASAQELVNDLEAAKQKLVPKAAAFSFRSSCAMPRRSMGHAAHEAQEGETGTGPVEAVSGRAGLVLAALGLLVALGAGAAGAYWIWGRHGNEHREPASRVAQVLPQVPVKRAVDNPWAEEGKAHPVVKPHDPATPAPLEAKAPPAEPPKAAWKERLPAPPQTDGETTAVSPGLPGKGAGELAQPAVPPATLPPAKSQEAPAKAEETGTMPPEPVALPAKNPEEVQVTAARKDIPEEEPPAPKVVSTPDMLYARFLAEFRKPEAKGELRKFQEELKDLGAKPEFDVARADVNADLDDLALAIVFEQEAVKALAAAGGTLELNEEAARKYKASKGKIMGFDPARGIEVGLGGVSFYISASSLSMPEILKYAPDKSPAAQLRYLLARGYVEEAKALLTGQGKGLKPELLARYERKLLLLTTGEMEQRAQAAFDNLAKVAEAKHWRTFTTLAADFDKLYGNTSVATQHVADLLQWKHVAVEAQAKPAAPKAALSPPVGLEATGKFSPVPWQGTNICEAQTVVDPVTGTKVLRIEGKAGAGAPGNGDKSALTRGAAPALKLTGKTSLVFRAKHTCKTDLPVAFGFLIKPPDGYYEVRPVLVPAGGWAEMSVPIDGAIFKCKETNYLAYDTALPSTVAQNLIILVYTKEPYGLEIAGIALR